MLKQGGAHSEPVPLYVVIEYPLPVTSAITDERPFAYIAGTGNQISDCLSSVGKLWIGKDHAYK